MPSSCGDVEFDPHSRAVPNVDEPVLDNRVGQPVDDVVPPGRVTNRVLESDVICGQRCTNLDEGGQAEEAVARTVGRHEHPVEVGVLGDPFQFGDPTYVAWVRPDDIDRMVFDQALEVLSEVDLLAGVNGRGGGPGHLAVNVGVYVLGVVAGNEVLGP